MRYYTYVEPGQDDEPVWVTLSEEEIRAEYWPYWYGRMCSKFGQAHVDAHYSFEECLEDWTIVHWAQRTCEHGAPLDVVHTEEQAVMRLAERAAADTDGWTAPPED